MAVVARIFSFCSSVETTTHVSASPATGNGRRRRRIGGSIVRSSAGASEALLPNDIDLQDGLTHVQTIIHQSRKSARQMMVAVDNLKRLCIDHYFEEEVDNAMDRCWHLLHSDDLFDATLAFRLMREAGHEVSADDVLQKFTDRGGEFSLALCTDIRGLLSLHDLSHLNIGEESSLYKAKEFSTKHLTSAMRYLEPNFAKYVRQSLDHPYHLSLKQYKARHHLRYLQSLPNRSTARMEELAIAEFQRNKPMHQMEMQAVKRWWMDLGLTQEIPVVRDQVLKWYMWAMTILQGSSFSQYRVEITKIISFIYVVDDIFDLLGTPQELSCFTDAIKKWDIAAADSLPTYMRSCYKALYNVTNEIADMAKKEHGFNPTNYLGKAWATLFEGLLKEAKWLSADHVPAAEDYLRNGVVTSAFPLLFAHILVLLGHDDAASNDAAKVISCQGKIFRLYDDMGSAKDEAQEGLDGSYGDLYLMENPSCTPTDAEEHMLSMIAMEWEKLNRECFVERSLPSSFTQACLNSARMISVMHRYNEEQKLPFLEDYTNTLLL